MTFRVGQKVVCIFQVPAERRRADCVYPEKGSIYTVRGFSPRTDGVESIYLHEIVNPPLLSLAGRVEWGFRADKFRPIVSRPASIEIFTAMLKPSKVDA